MLARVVALYLALAAVTATCGARLRLWDSEGLRYAPPTLAAPAPEARQLMAELLSRPYAEPPEAPGAPVRRRRAPEIVQETTFDKTLSTYSGAEVTKCCGDGMSFSKDMSECVNTSMNFTPMFTLFNGTHTKDMEGNLFETTFNNPCKHKGYIVDPSAPVDPDSGLYGEIFFLLPNGSVFIVQKNKSEPNEMLMPDEFCMEMFWDEKKNDAVALPYICFPPDPEPSNVWIIIIAILMLISVPFLIVTSLTYLLVGKLNETSHGRAAGAHCACLAVAFFALALAQLLSTKKLSHAVCITAAYIIQFSFLACFFWLNILCYDIYQNIKRVAEINLQEENRRFRWYSIYAWCSPLLVTIITLIMEHTPGLPISLQKPQFGTNSCWFNTDVSTALYFYAPVTCILVSNIVLFALAARELARRQDSNLSSIPMVDYSLQTSKLRRNFRVVVALVLVMGISWILEIISWWIGGKSMLWIFGDIFNALQGITIFALFMRKKVTSEAINALKRQFPQIWPPSPDRVTSNIDEYTTINSYLNDSIYKNTVMGMDSV